VLSRLLQSHRILALSPHLDDAALSIGGAIAQATESRADVIVATIFTGDAPPSTFTTPIIRELNARWRLGPSPMASRRSEDAAAIQILGARHIHGGLLDAIYRTDRNGNSIYPSRQAIFSKPSLEDGVAAALTRLMTDWIEEHRPDFVLCPLAVGRHVDHVITSETFRTVARDQRLDIYLYEDLPYSTGLFPPGLTDTVEAALARTNWRVAHSEQILVDFSRKIASVKEYKSQISDLFSDDRQMETALARYMSCGDGVFCERIWAVSK
jgi:LmbE family N-acetylglucosaminyl deacetylase